MATCVFISKLQNLSLATPHLVLDIFDCFAIFGSSSWCSFKLCGENPKILKIVFCNLTLKNSIKTCKGNVMANDTSLEILHQRAFSPLPGH